MYAQTDDVRIEGLRPLIPPAILMEEIPASEAGLAMVAEVRAACSAVLRGDDDRLVVVCGPCSIHDPKAGLEYAERLRGVAAELRESLVLVMRTYFEKPRTTVGWKGLINDPGIDGSFRINEGLRIARGFLRDVVDLGLPPGTEFLDPISPQFIADLVAWGAIGARTTESQVHRELASGLSMPVGFKNGTSGNVQIAIDAVRSAMNAHRFLSVTKQGITAIVTTRGNPDCHVILRGGREGPNYAEPRVLETAARLARADLSPRVMVDASHANSGRDHRRQPEIADDLARQIAGGSRAIAGLMMESFLVEGRQEPGPPDRLTFGQSITDACMSWEQTVPVLASLAEAVERRRQRHAA